MAQRSPRQERHPGTAAIRFISRLLTLAMIVLLIIGSTAPKAMASAAHVLAQNVSVTNADIAASLQRNGFSQSFSQAAANLSSGIENRSGQLALYNGSCCTGVLQMNNDNLTATCGCTRAQYAAMTLDEQTKYWGQTTRQGYRAEAIRKLNTMTTFDNQPVDDALKLACVQLGTGNCNTMLTGGHCGSFADRNGMTICRMAAGIRAGGGNIGSTTTTSTAATQTPTANTTNDNPISVSQDPSNLSINGNSIAMGNPIYCWSCDAIIYSMAFAEAAIVGGLPAILDVVLPLLIIAAMCGILYRILIGMVAGIDPIKYALGTMLRAALVLSVLSNGGSVIQDIMLNYVMVPVLNGSTGVGQYVATKLGASFGLAVDNITPNQGSPTTPTTDTCTFNQNNVTLNYLQDAEGSALSLACTIHQAMTTEVQIGILLANSNANASGVMQRAKAAGIQVAGWLMTSVGIIGMVKFGLLFLDIMASMGVAMAFLPWSLYCWIFESTQISFTNLWKRMLHAMVACLMSGIASIAAIVIMLGAMQAGIGADPVAPGGAPAALSASGVLIAAQQIIQQMDQNIPVTMAISIRFIMFTICGALAANHILGQSQAVVSSITGLRVSAALSKAVSSAVTSLVGISLGLGAGAVGAVAGPIGRLAGRLGGRLLEE